jgi:glutathione-regulated potassium-efflux system ancillary protein KefC
MIEAILFLAAALVFVPLAVRLGLGPVLGYLLAGVAIGPFGLSLISDHEAILHISELGVVLMLFLIGLELEPKRLWAMRAAVFGGGSMQMTLCAALLFPLGLALGWGWQAALIGSLALSLSSTAIAVALMQERNLLPLPVGRTGFAMLLYQDIAAIPLLALAAALGGRFALDDLVPSKAAAGGLLLQLAALAVVILVGRYVAYPLMRFIGGMKVRELFTGFALLLVLGAAALMERVGLSMGLGAFLAGVLLASSEYRHALEADILPFKGLLLGLFFIAVGMSMDLGLFAVMPGRIVGGLLAVVAIKVLGLWLVSLGCDRMASEGHVRGRQRMLLAVLLSQVGEFSFVVIGAALEAEVLRQADASLLTLIAALSMATTPLLILLFDRWGAAAETKTQMRRPHDVIDNEQPEVILAGFGRYGQTVGRLLLAAHVRTTVIDHDAETVDAARRFGFKVYFGDATHRNLLHAAGIEQARAVVVAIDGRDQTNALVKLVQREYPQLPVIVRARDAVHYMELDELGVRHVERELFESSLSSARAALEAVGFDSARAQVAADNFRHHAIQFLRHAQTSRHDEQALIANAQRFREKLQREMLEEMARVERIGSPAVRDSSPT